MIIIVCAGIAGWCSTAVYAVKLRTTRRELSRARRRMARLDEVADELASREVETELARSADEESSDMAPTGLSRDSGSFAPVGLQHDTDEVLEDELFAAPRMGLDVIKPKQQASRQRHQTPSGSPRTLMPEAKHSLVAVGKIQIRSDYVDEAEE